MPFELKVFSNTTTSLNTNELKCVVISLGRYTIIHICFLIASNNYWYESESKNVLSSSCESIGFVDCITEYIYTL